MLAVVPCLPHAHTSMKAWTLTELCICTRMTMDTHSNTGTQWVCKGVQRSMQDTSVFISSFPGSQGLGALEVLHSRKVNTIYEQKSPLWEASVSRSDDSRIRVWGQVEGASFRKEGGVQRWMIIWQDMGNIWEWAPCRNGEIDCQEMVSSMLLNIESDKN